MDNYLKLVDRIAESASIEKEEVERRVEAKRAKLSGLVSKEGAAQIVAAELGINFDQERLKISELVHGMKRVNVIGKVVEVYPIREYSKGGREGKIGSFLFADEVSNIRTVLWDTNHISLLEEGKIKKDDVLEISNGGIRNGEMHLSSFGDIKHSKEEIGEVVEQRVLAFRDLENVRPGESLRTRAFIVQTFEPRYFEVCPECKKKAVEGKCGEHGAVEAEKRALLNIVLDDGQGTIRCVLFGDQIYSLGLTEEEVFSLEKFEAKKPELLGQERIFSGNIRSNQLYNTTEMSINGVEDINTDELVKELEASTV